ncbi:MAG: glycoside hydrolase family 127 protein [Anaerolineales bacterium]|nr:glycoside hydrolase family 127 protein [Anaerolineales bacterium]
MKFQTLPLGTVRPTGWILSQLQNDLDQGFASRLDSLTERAATDLFSKRIESSSQQFAWWDSETRGNWLWGYTMMAGLAEIPEHQSRVLELLNILKQTQDADGYIGIYSAASRYQHGDDENGELWGQSRAMLAMLAQYELTNDANWLLVVQAAVDLTLQKYGVEHSYFRQPKTRNDLIGMTHGLCYVDVVEWLYRITGEARYRDFGVWLYQDFNQMQLPFANDDMALSNLLDPHRHLNGHAVHTVEHLRALLFASEMGDSPQCTEALKNAMLKLSHYTLPSGAVLGDEGLHGLPTPDIGYEYCTLTELLLSLSSALLKSGDASLGDWTESLAFNAAQGARFANGSGLAYLSLDSRFSALNDRPDSYSHLHGKHGRFKYSPTHEDVACCCNPNAVRFMPHYISRMWMGLSDRPGFAAATYGPCVLKTQIDNVNLTITEETDYPFSDTIRFTISTDQDINFELFLRKPAWSAAVTMEGAVVREENGWLIVSKTWMNGDSFALTFHPKVVVMPYPNGEYAIKRGALQYVYPIEYQLRSIKDYPFDAFHDYEVFPKNMEQAYRSLILDESRPGYGLKFVLDENIQPGWGQPSGWLELETNRLVPIGCTLLRRASFPLKLKR